MIKISDFADEFIYEWIRELVYNGRAFPDFQDGLKDSTRSIITEVARMSDFRRKPVPAEVLVGNISNYREGSQQNVEKNLYRLASSNTPLIDITSEDKGKTPGLNRMTGGHSMSRYLKVTLTPLGIYALKYRNYFKYTATDTGSGISKYVRFESPFPLSLVMSHSNLSDGFSNKSPSLNIVEVIDAYIEHLMKDKKTTTEDLAKHITGFEITEGTTILTSNQALYDFIERGIMKGVALTPIEIYKNEILIKELPFKQFGNSVRKDFYRIIEAGSKDYDKGFQTFKVVSILPEHSDESFVTIGYELNKGYSIEDVREEIYKKTKLKERLVYENFVLDHDSDKPLKVMSIRDILDFHVDKGIQLKTLEVKDKLHDLEKTKEESIFLEKVTRETCIAVIGKILGWEHRERFIRIYLPKLNQIFHDLGDEKVSINKPESLGDFEKIKYVIEEQLQRLTALTEERYGEYTLENYHKLIDVEIPNEFTEKDLNRVWMKEYLVLYDLNKRDKAIEMLASYERRLKELQDLLSLDSIKAELKKEMLELRKQYEGKKFSKTLFALREQEREFRKQLKRKVSKAIKELAKELPVNIWIDNDYKARLSYDLAESIPNAKYLFEGTTTDNLIIINRKGQSTLLPVQSLTKEPQLIADSENVIGILFDSPLNYFHVFLTNKGRASIVSSKTFKFNNRTLSIALADDEHFVYMETIPVELYSEMITLVALTEDGKFKRKALSEFVVKNSLGEFFSMFAGPSSCNNVVTGFINGRQDLSINMWNGEIVSMQTKGGFKRNVSKGEQIDTDITDMVYVGDKVPMYESHVVPNIRTITGIESLPIPNKLLLDNYFEVVNQLPDEINSNDIKWVKRFLSSNRENFVVDESLNEVQLKMVLGHLT